MSVPSAVIAEGDGTLARYTDAELIKELWNRAGERMSGGKQGKRARQDRINAEWAALARACKGCIYFTARRCCDYIGIVGHRRPCPPGPGCTVKTTGDRRRKVDYGKVEDLYRRKKTDKGDRRHCRLRRVHRGEVAERERTAGKPGRRQRPWSESPLMSSVSPGSLRRHGPLPAGAGDGLLRAAGRGSGLPGVADGVPQKKTGQSGRRMKECAKREPERRSTCATPWHSTRGSPGTWTT